MFTLDKKLATDHTYLTTLQKCQVYLKKDDEIPWIILVPQIPNLVELIDLNNEDYILVMNEIKLCATMMKEVFKPFKLNIANLGNIVPQLHIHIIARSKTDRAWPNPVWGTISKFDAKTRESQEQIKIERIISYLNTL